MQMISALLAREIAEAWETMAELETQAEPARRETLRECADLLRMLAACTTPPAAAPPRPFDRAQACAELRSIRAHVARALAAIDRAVERLEE